MGARKHIKAEERKAALKTQYFAKLKGVKKDVAKDRIKYWAERLDVESALNVCRSVIL